VFSRNTTKSTSRAPRPFSGTSRSDSARHGLTLANRSYPWRIPKMMSRACSIPGTLGSPSAPSSTAAHSRWIATRTSGGNVVPSRR
jgi:hypothetical protein